MDGVAVEQRVFSPEAGKIEIDLVFPDGGDGGAELFYTVGPTEGVRVELPDTVSWHSEGIVSIPAGTEGFTISLSFTPDANPFVRPGENLSGEQLYKLYCIACHSTDGTKLIGPTFQGLAGREQKVTRNGEEQTIATDAAYLRESITDPQAAIVVGYEAVPMVSFKDALKKDQIDRLVKYIEGL